MVHIYFIYVMFSRLNLNDFRHLLPDPDRYLISIYNHIWLICFCFILILNVAWLFDSYFCWFIFFKYKHSCTKTRVLMIYFVYAQYKQHALKIHVKWYSEMFITITTIYWRESQWTSTLIRNKQCTNVPSPSVSWYECWIVLAIIGLFLPS